MCMSMASPTAAVTQVHYSIWDLTPLDPPLFCVLCWPVHCFTDPLPPLWYCCKSPIFEPCQCFACWPGSRAAHVKYVAGTSHGRRPADSIGTGAGESRSEQAEACCTSALLSPCTLWVLAQHVCRADMLCCLVVFEPAADLQCARPATTALSLRRYDEGSVGSHSQGARVLPRPGTHVECHLISAQPQSRRSSACRLHLMLAISHMTSIV